VLDTEFRDVEPARYSRVVFTGAIDEYFGYQHGALSYRSVRFDIQDQAPGARLPSATVNYPNEFSFTRVTDMGLVNDAPAAAAGKLVYEYPQAHAPGLNDPYYPVPTSDSAAALAPYQALAQELSGQVWFAGRLGDYAYY